MSPRALVLSSPVVSHSPPRSVLVPVALPDKGEPAIRRYAMHWLQHAAARVHKRCERTQRQRLLVASVLGVHQLFDVSDVTVRPRKSPLPGFAGLGELETGSFRRL